MNTPTSPVPRAAPIPAHPAGAPAASCSGDWRTIAMLLPQRRFTAAELARAVPEPPSWTLKLGTLGNVLLPLLSMVGLLGPQNPLAFSLLLLGIAGATLAVLSLIWRNPSSTGVRWVYYTMPLTFMALAFALKRWLPGIDRQAHMLLGIVLMMVAFGLWFALVYRYQHIVMRLRELDERDRAIDMARQLASAQIQPHFLFNSLASLQHWVHTRDERAGPMLDSLTAYLRATLPLFERQHLSVAQEFEAVQRYLEVMQARLGERLRFELVLQPEAGATAMPPGLLLTLVENAVEHGVSPQLAGGTVRVAARRDGQGRTLIEVVDDGPGLPPAPAGQGGTEAGPGPAISPWQGHDSGASPGRGVGLRNIRERLAQAYGERASLQLGPAPGGGCLARLSLP